MILDTLTAGISNVTLEQYVHGHNDTGAIFSIDQRYRYVLWRTWAPGPRRLVVIGLNPSTADATTNDRTVSRCMTFAQRERCSGLVMLNLFAYRATDPKRMRVASDPIGPNNDRFIRDRTRGGDLVVVAAWGAHGSHLDRAAKVCRLGLPAMRCFGVTKDGSPKHPLYLAANTSLVPFTSVQQ